MQLFGISLTICSDNVETHNIKSSMIKNGVKKIKKSYKMLKKKFILYDVAISLLDH